MAGISRVPLIFYPKALSIQLMARKRSATFHAVGCLGCHSFCSREGDTTLRISRDGHVQKCAMEKAVITVLNILDRSASIWKSEMHREGAGDRIVIGQPTLMQGGDLTAMRVSTYGNHANTKPTPNKIAAFDWSRARK